MVKITSFIDRRGFGFLKTKPISHQEAYNIFIRVDVTGLTIVLKLVKTRNFFRKKILLSFRCQINLKRLEKPSIILPKLSICLDEIWRTFHLTRSE